MTTTHRNSRKGWRWAILGLVSVASTACRPAESTSTVPVAAAPVVPPRAEAATLPKVKFVEVTGDAGIDFVHTNAALGEKLLPETMGSGVAFLDYDSDGDQDLLFLNQEPWPNAKSADRKPTQKLYSNDGKGTYRDVTADAGLAISMFGMGVAVGDSDNDGDPDLYLTGVGGGRFLRNDEGKYVDITPESGTAASGWLTSAAFFDLENDGDLDLFVCSYVDWNAENDRSQAFQLTGGDRAYGPPTAFKGTFCFLFRNEGGNKFADISEASGIQIRSAELQDPLGKSLGVAPYDIDGDGFTDLAVANDTVRNFLFRNRGDGTFEEIGMVSGVAFDQSGNVRGAMGIDWAHFKNDRSLGLAIGNFANEMTALYVADDPSSLQFTDLANLYGLGAPTQPPLKFGLFFFDYDLDGRLDLLSANGHLESDIEKTQASEKYRQSAQLFWNSGRPGRQMYELVGPQVAGPDLFTPIVGRGSAYADIDGDGDLDVVITSSGEKARLFRNDGGNDNHWLRLKLIGRASNRDGLGAKIEVKSSGLTQERQHFVAKGYLSSVEAIETFGLGSIETAESIRVTWPSGRTTELKDVKSGTLVAIEEPEAGVPAAG